jgi:hypothetical protein
MAGACFGSLIVPFRRGQPFAGQPFDQPTPFLFQRRRILDGSFSQKHKNVISYIFVDSVENLC